MSTLESKLERPAASTSLRSLAKLKRHLVTQMGYRVLTCDESGPLTVETGVPGRLHTWKRLNKADGDWWFERR